MPSQPKLFDFEDNTPKIGEVFVIHLPGIDGFKADFPVKWELTAKWQRGCVLSRVDNPDMFRCANWETFFRNYIKLETTDNG